MDRAVLPRRADHGDAGALRLTRPDGECGATRGRGVRPAAQARARLALDVRPRAGGRGREPRHLGDRGGGERRLACSPSRTTGSRVRRRRRRASRAPAGRSSSARSRRCSRPASRSTRKLATIDVIRGPSNRRLADADRLWCAAMFETEGEIDELDALLARTYAHANEHLTAIVKPERRLNARQVVRYLQGTKHVAFTTVNERDPAACSTVRRSVHPRPVHGVDRRCSCAAPPPAREPGVQRCAHGRRHGRHRRTRTRDDHRTGRSRSRELEPVWREIYGSSPFEWGDGVVFMRIEPTSMWAYAFQPENFPASRDTDLSHICDGHVRFRRLR